MCYETAARPGARRDAAHRGTAHVAASAPSAPRSAGRVRSRVLRSPVRAAAHATPRLAPRGERASNRTVRCRRGAHAPRRTPSRPPPRTVRCWSAEFFFLASTCYGK